MAFDQGLIDADEGLILADRAFDLGFLADAAPPLIRAGRRIAVAPSLRVLPAEWEHVGAPTKESLKEGDLLFARRMHVNPSDVLSGRGAGGGRLFESMRRSKNFDFGDDGCAFLV